jgi:hypothetical protein
MPQPLRQPQRYSSISSYQPKPIPPPEKSLAAAVLAQAAKDFRTGDAATRAEVQQWLDDPQALRLWCDVLDLDPQRFQQHARQQARG